MCLTSVRSKCIDYVKKSQNSDGGFRYQITSGGSSSFPLTAAGVVSLYSAGIYDGEPVEKALKWLMEVPARQGIGQYQLLLLRPLLRRASDVARWRRLLEAVVSGDSRRAAQSQASDGSWTDNEVCSEFGTAMACIILQMPNNFLPIFTP